jgi:outer membrane protein assembly factor BamB
MTLVVQPDRNWREHAFDAQNTGCNPYETALSPATVNGLQPLWSKSFYWSVYSNPSVVDGVVYMGTYGDYFYAFDAETGDTLWQRYVDGCTDSPAIYDGIVYFGSRHTPTMYALDAKDGSIVWSKPVNDRIVESSPTVVDGVLYVGTAENGETLYALDPETGATLWTATCKGKLQSPTVADGIVHVTGYDGTQFTIFSFDAKTGNPLWSLPISNGQLERRPLSVAVSEGVIYTGGADGNLYALNPMTGDVLWTGKTGGMQVDAPSVANGVVYVAANDSTLYAFDAETHDLIWSVATPNDLRGIPIVANGVVYAAEAEGPLNVYAFDAQTGDLLWNHHLGGNAGNTRVSPTVADGRMYLSGTFGYTLYAFHIPE